MHDIIITNDYGRYRGYSDLKMLVININLLTFIICTHNKYYI